MSESRELLREKFIHAESGIEVMVIVIAHYTKFQTHEMEKPKEIITNWDMRTEAGQDCIWMNHRVQLHVYEKLLPLIWVGCGGSFYEHVEKRIEAKRHVKC